MVRISFTLAALAIVVSAGQLDAQQITYSGSSVYTESVPSYPIAEPIVSHPSNSWSSTAYPSHSAVIRNEVAPYPIAAPLEYATSSSDTVKETVKQSTENNTVEQQTVAAAKTAETKSETKPATQVSTHTSPAPATTSLPTFRKSTKIQAQPARVIYANPAPQVIYSQPVQRIAAPVTHNYQPPAPAVHAPSFFAPQNCFRGR